MLGDDVIEGTKSGIATLGHAVKNAAKGALLFAAVAAVAVLGYEAIAFAMTPAIEGAVAATAAAPEGGMLGAALETVGKFISLNAGNALKFATYGAVGGGIVAGAGSLIPGSEEGLSLKKLFARKPKAQEPARAPQQEAVVQQSTAPTQQEAPVAQEKTHRPFSHHKQQTNNTNQTNHTVVDNSQNTQIVHADTHTVNNYHTAPQQGNAGDDAPAPVTGGGPTGDLPNAPAAAASQPQQSTKQEEPAVANTSAPLLNTEGENPLYRPGKGAELMQRGNERSNEMAAAR